MDCLVLLFTAIVLGFPAISIAQSTAEPRQPVYTHMFRNPTGHNAFEDIVKAGDLVAANAALNAATTSDATLTVKRVALADKDVKQALEILRFGLAKNAKPIPTADQELLLQSLSLFRQLGRLLNVEQYVCWADGRTAQAIDSLRDSLRLGYLVQSQAIIGNLVGIAIDKTALNTVNKRIDQFSVNDCRKVRLLAEEWMKSPDPAIAAIIAEQAGLPDRLGEVPNKQDIVALLGARYDAMKRMLQRAPWERTLPVQLESRSPASDVADVLWKQMEPMFTKIMDRWSEELAQIQILGIHAAIRAHRWEYGMLPTSLDLLNLGRMSVDPFTGKPFIYKVTGVDTYELSSKGPQPADQTSKPSQSR